MCLSATAFCVAESVSAPLPSLKGELAEVVEDLELAIGPAGSASLCIGADEPGVGAEGKSLVREAAGADVRGGIDLAGALSVAGLLPSASASRSRKSFSSRPFDGST